MGPCLPKEGRFCAYSVRLKCMLRGWLQYVLSKYLIMKEWLLSLLVRRVQGAPQRLEAESIHRVGAVQVRLWQFSVGSLFSYLPPPWTVFGKGHGRQQRLSGLRLHAMEPECLGLSPSSITS